MVRETFFIFIWLSFICASSFESDKKEIATYGGRWMIFEYFQMLW